MARQTNTMESLVCLSLRKHEIKLQLDFCVAHIHTVFFSRREKDSHNGFSSALNSKIHNLGHLNNCTEKVENNFNSIKIFIEITFK